MTAQPDPAGGWTDHAGWNRVLEHRSRLGACVLLSRIDALSFRRLKDLLHETDGNLGAHLKRLEEDGLVRSTKTHEDKRPVTWYALTPRGKKQLRAHLSALDAMIAGLREEPS